MDLRRYLFENRLTTAAFARSIGYTAEYIGKISNGKIKVCGPVAAKIEKATNGQVKFREEDLFPHKIKKRKVYD